MLNSTPEYVAAHQRDLAALKSDKGAAAALAVRRAARVERIYAVLSTFTAFVARRARPRRTADAATGRAVADSP